MKKVRSYTIRGTLLAAEVKRIQLFDGQFDTGFILKKFIITPQNINDSEKVTCKLLTEEKTHGTNWFWGRQSEIGWASWNTPTNSRYGQFNLIDPDAIIIEDLFIDASGDSGVAINYYIEMEKVKVSEWKGALAMVRNSNQDV